MQRSNANICKHLLGDTVPVGKHGQKHAVEIVTKLLKIMTDEVFDYIHNVSPLKHNEKTKYDINCVESSYIKHRPLIITLPQCKLRHISGACAVY